MASRESRNRSSASSLVGLEQATTLLERLLQRFEKSSDSAQWKAHRAASRGLNDPTAAARSLKVAPGRVNRLIRAGAVRLYPVDDRYHYVRVEEVRQALENELTSMQADGA